MSTEPTALGGFIGREAEIATVDEALESSSRLVVGARRIGKSRLAKQICARPPRGWRAVRLDLESETRTVRAWSCSSTRSRGGSMRYSGRRGGLPPVVSWRGFAGSARASVSHLGSGWC